MTVVSQGCRDNLDTLPKLLLQNCRQYGDMTAVRHKSMGIWQCYSWKDCYERVKRFSSGMLALGLSPGERVAIVGDPAPYSYWAEMAILAAGGIAVGIFSDASSTEIYYFLRHSESSFLVAKDREQVEKVLPIRDQLPMLRRIVYWDSEGVAPSRGPILISFEEVSELGCEYERANSGDFERKIAQGRGHDPALMQYTSGAASQAPKAAILRYDSLLATAHWLVGAGLVKHGDNYVSYLSPALLLEQQAAVFTGMLVPFVVNFGEKPESVASDLREIAPQFVIYLPPLLEQMMHMTISRMEHAGGLGRRLYQHAMGVAQHMLEQRMLGRNPNILQQLEHFLADLAIFRPLRDKLGLLNARGVLTGGAGLSPEVFRFFRAIGVPLIQAYCLTECPFCIAQKPQDADFQTMGQATPGHEVSLSEQGELLVRGSGLFDGYYKESQIRNEWLTDGWFHTGDAASIDQVGHVTFLGRMADIVRLKDGSKSAPEQVEARLRTSPFVRDVLVTAKDGEAYLIALIVIDSANVGAWAAARGLTYASYKELSQRPEVCRLVEMELARVNSQASPREKVKRFVVLPWAFEADRGEVTRTGKLKRSYIKQRYQKVLESLYHEEEEVVLEGSASQEAKLPGAGEVRLGAHTVQETSP